MAREWKTQCADCGSGFGVSDFSLRAVVARGESGPALCPPCYREYMRELRAIARPDLQDRLPTPPRPLAQVPAVGAFERIEHPSTVAEQRGEFGVSDERLLEFYEKLDQPETQVMIVVAPRARARARFFPIGFWSHPMNGEYPIHSRAMVRS